MQSAERFDADSSAAALEVVERYLNGFRPIEALPRALLLQEMDRAWDAAGLDNARRIDAQLTGIAEFYGHPVWILNGLFSGYDPESVSHRAAIARQVNGLQAKRVADYGGGSGVLATRIVAEAAQASVDIVEPYPFQYFLETLKDAERIRFVTGFDGSYDVVIAQDVLEHVDEPIAVALDMAEATREGGTLIFANSFFPEIKCHLPSTFYLRHQFAFVMRAAGLLAVAKIPGLHHSAVFQRRGPIDRSAARRADALAKAIGPGVNQARGLLSSVRRALPGRA